MTNGLHFEADDLPESLERASEAERHALPFGVIKLDASFRVTFYSRTEARQSGYGERPIRNLDFFHDVAPCMDTADYRGRIERARKEGTLDIELGHTGDFADRARFFRVRAMSAADGGIWLAHLRDL
jgi:photoactive yellow protein